MTLSLLAPQLALAGALVGLFALGAAQLPRPSLSGRLGVGALLAAALLLPAGGSFGPTIGWDGPARLWSALFFLGAIPLLAVLPAEDEVPAALVLGSALGMSLLAVSRTTIGLFLGLELMSLPAYLMVWAFRRSPASLEAAVKYFFAGATAGALFVLGAGLAYGGSGTLELRPVATDGAAFGLALMTAAALFKIGAFPLHFWLPDAYEASRPELAGWMSTAMKAAAVLLLMRLVALAAPESTLVAALAAVAGCTMTLGNLLALRQSSLQRLLAYSSIAHAGYLLLGVAAWARLGAAPGGAAAVFVYLAAYLAMNTGAFLILRLSGLQEVRQLKGLGAREPALAAFLALMLVSLAGIPPTAGFLAKFLVFWDGVKAGLLGLVLLAAANTLVGLGYYFRLIRLMYFEEPEGAPPPREPAPGGTALLWACALPTVVLGLWPGAAQLVKEALSR